MGQPPRGRAREEGPRGFAVYAVFDELANLGQPADVKRFPDGINFRRFSGPGSVVNPRNAHREHRKLLTVDGRVASAGGFNIGDHFTAWRDTHVRVRGPEAHEMEHAFAAFWETHRGEDLPPAPPLRGHRWDPSTGFLVNDPYHLKFPIRDSYLGVLGRAQDRVWLTTAYFTPGPNFRRALIAAADRGADVQVLFPEASNHPLTDWLARRHLGHLLRNGVRVFLYEDFMLHAKTITVDGVWSAVGSANIDSLSLLALNESVLEVYSERFAAKMEETFELDKTNASELTLDEWESRPLHEKLLEWGITPMRIFG